MESRNIDITVLYNDIAGDPRLEDAHGLSCWIEGAEKTILFDTGGDGHLLLENMQKLGKDPKRIDMVIISHQHWDHSGGLFTLQRAAGPVKVFVPKDFPMVFVGHIEKLGGDVTLVDGPTEILPGIHSTGQMGTENLARDRREQSLVLDTTEGTAVLTGCAHPGIVDIVKRAKEMRSEKIAMALGGFHLKVLDEYGVDGVIKELKDLGVEKMAASHCTGELDGPQLGMFERAWANDFIPFGCGVTVQLHLKQ